MAHADANFELQDLDAIEVSLVPKAANKRKFLLMKMDEEGIDMSVEKAERPTKSDGGKNYYSSDYAYVPDPQSPSTWKLRLTNTPGGEPDAGIVGAALAALGKGFRGNKVSIPSEDLAKVKAKVRVAWKKANPDKDSDEMPEVIAKSLDEQFEEEILKEELGEVLLTPVANEEAILQELVEKRALSPRALQAVRGAARLLRGFERELPGDFVDMIRGLMGASQESATAGKQAGTVNKSDKEEMDMANDVKKEDATQAEDPTKAVAPEKSEPVVLAKVEKATKKQDDMEDEEDDTEAADKKKKLPPFLKDKKAKTTKEDLLAALPEEIRESVSAIFKSNEDLAAQTALIKKENEETLAELTREKDARATEQAIQKAEKDYPNLPVKAVELGPMVKAAKAAFTVAQVATFERILKAADNAIAESNAMKGANENSFVLGDGSEESAYAQLQTIAKGYIAKAETKLTEAQAFTKAVEANPTLYSKYMKERNLTSVEG